LIDQSDPLNGLFIHQSWHTRPSDHNNNNNNNNNIDTFLLCDDNRFQLSLKEFETKEKGK